MTTIQSILGIGPQAPTEILPQGEVVGVGNDVEFAWLLEMTTATVAVETPPPLVPPPPPDLPTGSEEANLAEPNARGLQPDFFLPDAKTSPDLDDQVGEGEEREFDPPVLPEVASILGFLPMATAVALEAPPPPTPPSPAPEIRLAEAVEPARPVEPPHAPAPEFPVDGSTAAVAIEAPEMIVRSIPEANLPSSIPTSTARVPSDDDHPSGVPVASEPAPREAASSPPRPVAVPQDPISIQPSSDSRAAAPPAPQAVPLPAPEVAAAAVDPGLPRPRSRPEFDSGLRTDTLFEAPKPSPPPRSDLPRIDGRILDSLNPIAVRVRDALPTAPSPQPLSVPTMPLAAGSEFVPLDPATTLKPDVFDPATVPTRPEVVADLTNPPVRTSEAVPVELAGALGGLEMADQTVRMDGLDAVESSEQSVTDDPIDAASLADADTGDQRPPSQPPSQTSAPHQALRTTSVEQPAWRVAVEPEPIARQIADRIEELTANRRGGSVTIHLDPKDLGTITLTVRSFGNRVDAEIGASHEGVRAALAENRQQLSQSIESRGLSLGQLSLSDHREFSQGTPWNHPDAREDLQRYANVRLADDPHPARSETAPWSLANDQSVDYRI